MHGPAMAATAHARTRASDVKRIASASLPKNIAVATAAANTTLMRTAATHWSGTTLAWPAPTLLPTAAQTAFERPVNTIYVTTIRLKSVACAPKATLGEGSQPTMTVRPSKAHHSAHIRKAAGSDTLRYMRSSTHEKTALHEPRLLWRHTIASRRINLMHTTRTPNWTSAPTTRATAMPRYPQLSSCGCRATTQNATWNAAAANCA
mmetsp:Transcript_43265/g.71958  ORF Transcript_43265/g.71958 Transcript_43265/m.71958 type:complete len:206 (-) Transcript_43265:638-1255(-)